MRILNIFDENNTKCAGEHSQDKDEDFFEFAIFFNFCRKTKFEKHYVI